MGTLCKGIVTSSFISFKSGLLTQFFLQIIIFSLTALHIATSLQFDLPGAENASGRLLFNAVCPNPSSNFANRLQSFSFPFILGVSGMILGGMLRAWCYATLGDLFTYLVTISPNHKLITSGPYAYVRHPSYTGVFLLLVSAIFTHFLSSGSFLTECGLMNSTIWKWFFRWWMMVAVFSLFSLRKRGKVEDTVMKKTFGEEWIVYRKAVPYAFIPFVL